VANRKYSTEGLREPMLDFNFSSWFLVVSPGLKVRVKLAVT